MSLLNKSKFVLIIGDDGAILIYINGTKVEKRVFSPTASLSDRREMNNLLTQFPSVPIYILLDTMEQTYTRQTLPAVSSLSVGKLVKKRLDRDFAASDLKGAVCLGRDSEGRRDWIYMFASTPVNNVISEWIEYVESIDNKFIGIYMLPVEAENLVTKIVKILYKDQEEKPVWQFLVTHNKTGGFRQVILQNGKVVFTRLIRPGKDNLPDIIAGNIEQEILNTVDYMRRLSLSEDEEVSVIVVVSEDIKKGLKDTKIRGHGINVFTPFEISEMLGFNEVTGKEDKFADIVLAVNFVNSKFILKLATQNMEKVNAIFAAETMATSVVLILIPVFLIYSAITVYSVFDISNKIKLEENQKASIEQKWKTVQSSEDYDIDEANKITDFVTLHNKFKQQLSPLEMIRKVSVSTIDYAMTKTISWTLDDPVEAEKEGVEHGSFDMEFFNKGNGLEDLFVNYDAFTGILKETLKGYDAVISELPEKVSFDTKDEVIAVQVKVTTLTQEN